jgi:DNA-binding NarL/FixJ family response regulator
MKPLTVSVVEDDPRLRATLVRLIDREEGFRCASEHADAEAALQEIPAVHPRVVLMDINLPGMNGVECVRRLKALLPDTQVVMLTVYEDAEIIFSALASGATGYLLKRTPAAEILAGIRDVCAGGSPMSSQIARLVVESFHGTSAAAPTDPLSGREREVLEHLAKGYLYKEIAAALNISYDTVREYIRRIYEKLQVHSRTEAVAKHLSSTPSERVARALGNGGRR